MRRLAWLLLVPLFACGCVHRVARGDLGDYLADERRDRERWDSAHASTGAYLRVPVDREWRFAGTRGDEHVVVHQYGGIGLTEPVTRRLGLPVREFVMPASLAYTDDESRWIPLKLVRRTRADGGEDLDFQRLSANEIDAAADPSLRKDAVRKGGL